jgi:hypothetical protein
VNEFLTFTQTQRILADRLGASTEEIAHEIAAWVWLRNLGAYQNVQIAGDRDAFQFSDGGRAAKDFDYLPKLQGCCFKKRDVEGFRPTERYLTGAALVGRWITYCDGETGAKRKIRSCCYQHQHLVDYFPGYGGTQASAREDDHDRWPPLEMALFSSKQIETIERAEFQKVPSAGKVEGGATDTGESVLESYRIDFRKVIPLSDAVLFIVDHVYPNEEARKAGNRVRGVIRRANYSGPYQGKLIHETVFEHGVFFVIGDPDTFWPWAVTKWRELQEVTGTKPPAQSLIPAGWDSSQVPWPGTIPLPVSYDELKQALADKISRLVQAEYDLAQCRARLAEAEAELEALEARRDESNKNRGRRHITP